MESVSRSKRVLMIINPISGNGYALEKAKLAGEYITNLGGFVDYRQTECAGDAGRIAASEAQNYDLLVCCGGDGTLSDVAGVLSFLEKPPQLGYIPCGTTNDFARCIGFSKDIEDASRDAYADSFKCFDIGRINDKSFLYVATFGAFSRCSYSTPRLAKSRFGHAAYVAEAAKEIGEIKPINLKVTLDEGYEIKGSFDFGAISSTSSYAGIIKADCAKYNGVNDGRFELTLIKPPKNPREALKIAKSLFSGKYNNDMFVTASSSHFVFEFEDGVEWSLDGEKACMDKIVVVENKKCATKINIRTED